jgi:hypothetical protein
MILTLGILLLSFSVHTSITLEEHVVKCLLDIALRHFSTFETVVISYSEQNFELHESRPTACTDTISRIDSSLFCTERDTKELLLEILNELGKWHLLVSRPLNDYNEKYRVCV